MKNIIFALFVILSFSSQAAPNPACSLKGTRILYTNGINTSMDEADEEIDGIKSLGINSKIDSKNVTYERAYNYNENFAKDILESAVQRLPQSYLNVLHVSNAYAAYSQLLQGNLIQSIASSVLNSIVEKKIEILVSFSQNYANLPQYKTTLTLIKEKYDKAYARGERVFAISHSQGSLFMNDVYNLLPINDNKNKYFTGFQIASVLGSEMDTRFGYATNSKDRVVNAVRLAIGALPANLNTPLLIQNSLSLDINGNIKGIVGDITGDVVELIANHGLLTTYLYDSTLKPQVISRLIATANLQESNCFYANIEYTKNNLEVLFDSGDPQDRNPDGLTYDWNFGDGQTATTNEELFPHTYLQAGTYNVSLTVTDAYGASDSVNTQVSVVNLDNILFNIDVTNSSYHYMLLYDDSVPRYAGTYHSLSMSATITGEIGTSITMQSHGELYDMDCGSWEKTNPPSQINSPIFLTCTRTQVSPETTSITARDVSQCGGEGCFFLQLPFWEVTTPGSAPVRVFPMTGATPENVGEIHYIGPNFPSPSFF